MLHASPYQNESLHAYQLREIALLIWLKMYDRRFHSLFTTDTTQEHHLMMEIVLCHLILFHMNIQFSEFYSIKT